MLFTVKFEQSPPVWAEGGDSANDPRRNQSRERKDFFALKPSPTGEFAGEIEKLRVFAESQGTVRLDASKVTSLTPKEALAFTEVMIGLRKRSACRCGSGISTRLEKMLRAAINERATEDPSGRSGCFSSPSLILQGKMDEFEELDLEVAVAFEMSPPQLGGLPEQGRFRRGELVATAAKAAAPPSPAGKGATS